MASGSFWRVLELPTVAASRGQLDGHHGSLVYTKQMQFQVIFCVFSQLDPEIKSWRGVC